MPGDPSPNGPSQTSPRSTLSFMSSYAEGSRGVGLTQSPVPGSGLKRTTTGCTTCRTRRIKCDEVKPICLGCQRSRRDCEWPNPNQARHKRKVHKRANSTACQACRVKKLRCIDGELGPCERCRDLGIDCVRRSEKHRNIVTPTKLHKSSTIRPAISNRNNASASSSKLDHTATGPALTGTSSPSTALPHTAELERLVDVYFNSIHHFGYFAFIHRLRLERLMDKGKAPRDLLLIMIANATRFGEFVTPDSLAQADAWADSAISSVLSTMYKGFGAVQLMVLLLAQHYEINRGNFTSAWLLGANCTRMMQMMSLHTFERVYPSKIATQSSLSPLLSSEALRRLAWSTFYIDTIVDGGRYGFHLVDERAYRLQLPNDEANFLGNEELPTGPLFPPFGSNEEAIAESRYLDLSAHLLRTAAARRQALFLAFRASHHEESVEQLYLEMEALRQSADKLIASLPRRYHFSTDNIRLHRDRLITFILLHVLRHNIYIVLDRAALAMFPRDVAHSVKIPQVRRNRISRALPIAGIINEGLKAKIALDPQIGVQAYVALEILLFEPRRLAEVDPTIEAKSESCMTAISQLLAAIREIGPRSMFVQQLHIEAVHRLLRCEYLELLTDEDLKAFSSEYRLVGQDVAEYDFRDFRWAKLERIRQGARYNINPASNEALLEYRIGQQTAAPSAVPSAATSPRLDALDVTRDLDPDTLALPLSTSSEMQPIINSLATDPDPTLAPHPSQAFLEPSTFNSLDDTFSLDLSWLLADVQPPPLDGSTAAFSDWK